MSQTEKVSAVDAGLSELEERVSAIEEDLKAIKTALYAIPGALEKEKIEIRKSLDAITQLKSGFQDVSETALESNRAVNNLERRVEGVKKDATSGFVVSTILFSILLIISLFVRS